MKNLISQIAAAGLGLWLSSIFVSGVKVQLLADSNFFGFPLTAIWQVYLILAVALGLLNYFVKPILNAIALPLRIITFGLFGFAINMALIWVLDYIFRELYVPLWMPLLYTSLIIWALNIIIERILNFNKQ